MKIIKLGLWIFSVLYLAALCLLWTGQYWPPEIYWLTILFQMIPLWTLYFPVGFLFIIALALKCRPIVVIHVISACIILFFIMDFNIPFPDLKRADIKEGSGLRIMTCNLGGVIDTSYLRDLISRTEPDIISMQEVGSKNKSALEAIFTPDRWDLSFTGGLGLASRLKIKNVETKDRNAMGGWGSRITRYELEGTSGRINLFNMHLDTPRTGIEAIMDKGVGGLSEIKQVVEMMSKESAIVSQWILPYRNVLIMGDFNMVDANPIYRKYWSSYTDVFSHAGHGFGYTKYTRWHGVRIDHVLCDSNWKAIHSEAGPNIGSDHRPLIADVEFIGAKFKHSQSDEMPVQNEPDSNVLVFENKEFNYASGGIQLGIWSIDTYPILRFTYFIQEGMQLEMRVKTTFDDWVSIGGTSTKQLINDGKWHEITIDIKETMKRVLPNVRYLQEFKFFSPVNVGGTNTFWIDKLKIMGKE